MATPPLVVKGLYKSYASTGVLHGLNLEVTQGAIHGLVGLNGSGKTTTLECILGLNNMTQGQISVLGYQPHQLFQAQGAVVAVFDSPCLHPGLTVRQVLEHARLLCGQRRGQARAGPLRSCAEVEQLLGISKYSAYKISHLSLGNRRRAAIAQALLGSPAFIVLDEPFNGLDVDGVDDVLTLIARLNQEQGTTFLLSSHQLPYLEGICTHLSILHKGQISLSGRIDEIFTHKHARYLLNCNNTAQAAGLLQQIPGVSLLNLSELERLDFPPNKLIEIEVLSVSSADINFQLVTQGVAVTELIIQKHTLATLFRDSTNGAES
ncbi:MAG: ABC transporter ATP-binding protein [Comamonas sp.]|nr:ABC transporter ATP-binding protein [Comamonas sp.]